MPAKEETKLSDLFLTFAKIGCFTFGGGYAMLPFIEKEVVNIKGWLKHDELVDVFAVAQAVPGAVAINSATFIGRKLAGIKGALMAALGMIFPSAAIITLIATFFAQIENNAILEAAFSGIRPAVSALIAVAAYRIVKSTVKSKWDLIVVAISALMAAVFDVHVVLLIVAGALFGLIKQKPFRKTEIGNVDINTRSNDIP